MGLLSRAVIAVVIIVIILALVYLAVKYFGIGTHVTEAQAVSLVVSDIQNSNPGALINVTNVTASQFPGSWHILMSVVLNATSPCPSYYIYSFDYPKYGFVYRVENNYTSNCVVYGLIQNKSYIIASFPVAIVRAYSFNASKSFISTYGYQNVSAKASFYNKLLIKGINYTNVWEVIYNAPNANHTEYVFLTQSGGNLIANYSIPK